MSAAWTRSGAYLRLRVRDEPGVIASVAETLAAAVVSIDIFLQKPVEDPAACRSFSPLMPSPNRC